MREALGPYRASLTQGRRRSLILLLLITIGIIGAIAWSSFVPLQNQRKLVKRFETVDITPQNFLDFSPGISCFGGDFGSGPPPAIEPQAPPLVPGSTQTEPTPKGTEAASPGPVPNQPTCRFIAPDGQPIGPQFQGDPFQKFKSGEVTQAFIDELRPAIESSLREQARALREQIRTTEKDLGLRSLYQSRVRGLGTFVGILFAVFFAATFVGAEIRWGVWRTLLTHEPRRGKLIASKFAALWTYVLAGFVAALAVTTAIDVVMRNLLEVDANVAGPSIVRLAKETGWAALSLGAYSSMAAALTIAVRTSLAGVSALLLLLGDHLLVTKYTWLRAFLPVQNIAWLLPQPATVASGYVWPEAIRIKFECVRRTADAVAVCRDVTLKPIPHWRASLVLGAWMIGFALAAWAIFRSRDIPQ